MTASARHDERCGDAAAVDVAAELDRIAGREQAVRGGARAGASPLQTSCAIAPETTGAAKEVPLQRA